MLSIEELNRILEGGRERERRKGEGGGKRREGGSVWGREREREKVSQ